MVVGDIFDYPKLFDLAEKNRQLYQNKDPFPYLVIDNAVSDTTILEDIILTWDLEKKTEWFFYNNPLEKKLANPNEDLMSNSMITLLREMNSSKFVRFLELLTGINDLITDPHYSGGGAHLLLPGGKLDLHVDYNYGKNTKLDRRLNVLLYLNKDWKKEWNGNLELWDKDVTECYKSVPPEFNRMVVFSTNEGSVHGVPDVVKCPEGQSRKSLALYYYTNGRPLSEVTAAHSTVFKKRPKDPEDPELDALRAARAKGRVADLKVIK